MQLNEIESYFARLPEEQGSDEKREEGVEEREEENILGQFASATSESGGRY